MAVMSFAHLKKNKGEGGIVKEPPSFHGDLPFDDCNESIAPIQAPQPSTKQTGVMSFAHLKKGGPPTKPKQVTKQAQLSKPNKQASKPNNQVSNQVSKQPKKLQKAPPTQLKLEKSATTQRTTYRIPGVAKTALLASANYCRHCPRFLPASEVEKKYGNPYGRCLREGELSEESNQLWRVIPARATVARCYYHINR